MANYPRKGSQTDERQDCDKDSSARVIMAAFNALCQRASIPLDSGWCALDRESQFMTALMPFRGIASVQRVNRNFANGLQGPKVYGVESL